MASLFVEADPPGLAPLRFSTDPAPLLALLSFGIAEPYGTQHPLTALIRRLKREHGIDVDPLLTFYDRDTEDAEDEAKLAAAWQPARSLRDCLAAVRAALSSDAAAAALLSEAGTPTLPGLLAELEAMAAEIDSRAEGAGRVQISFSLAEGSLGDASPGD